MPFWGAKEKEPRKSSGKGDAMLKQMGLGGMTPDDDEDEDLEAELLALQEGGPPARASKPKKDMNPAALDKMIADSMRDIGSEDDDDDDLEDADLLAQLEALSEDDEETSYEPPTKTVAPERSPVNQSAMIGDRLNNYKTAQANARSAGEDGKARRMDRGIKTLEDQLRKAKAGGQIDESDIPPAVATGTYHSKPTPPPAHDSGSSSPPPVYTPPEATRPAPVPAHRPSPRPAPAQIHAHTTPEDKPPRPALSQPPASLSPQDVKRHTMLCERRDQYKHAALRAKQNGKMDLARQHLKTTHQFTSVIKAVEEGKEIDLSKMPPPPPDSDTDAAHAAPVTSVRQEQVQGAGNVEASEEPLPELDDASKQKLFKAPESAGSVMEALQQRLEKYKSASDQAKEEGNSSKARRMGRITKQYEDAIKAHKAGKPVDYEDLPAPPGFPPIPVPSGQSQPAAPPAASTTSAPTQPSPGIRRQAPQPPAAQKTTPPRVERQTSILSRAEQQTIFLQERQLAYKKAALKAKNNGEVELAKKYLRMAKGFDQMIEASMGGLPVNLEQVPPLPESEGAIHTGNLEFMPADQPTGDRDEMYKKLERDLIQQIRTSDNNGSHFTKLGDVSTANKFDKLCQGARKDLDSLKSAYKHGDPVPRFHYNMQSFSMIQSCTDLGDNDLELVIVRGINYGLPSDLLHAPQVEYCYSNLWLVVHEDDNGFTAKDFDTYIKYELPYPSESQKGDSDVSKGSENPEYNQSFKLKIDRKARSFQRVLKSKAIKLEVFYKRGFFKGDKTLGVVTVKLQPLENSCIVHESYDLMDGRKTVGGKLEVKMRVRDPFTAKQVEEVKEKWLVIDHFERKLPPAQPRPAPVPKEPKQQAPAVPTMPQPSRNDYISMEVLKYEKQLLDQQIRKYSGKLTQTELDALQHKGALLLRQVEETRERLKREGPEGFKVYANAIERTQNQYLQEAKALLAGGNREKAQVLMSKKKLVEKEVDAIRAKLGGK